MSTTNGTAPPDTADMADTVAAWSSNASTDELLAQHAATDTYMAHLEDKIADLYLELRDLTPQLWPMRLEIWARSCRDVVCPKCGRESGRPCRNLTYQKSRDPAKREAAKRSPHDERMHALAASAGEGVKWQHTVEPNLKYTDYPSHLRDPAFAPGASSTTNGRTAA